jgi:hypothetical protein
MLMSDDRSELQRKIREFASAVGTKGTGLSNAARTLIKMLDREGTDPQKISEWLTAVAGKTADSTKLEEARHELLVLCSKVVSVSFLQLESDLQDVCSSQGWRIDGRWPDFFVNHGIQIHVDDRTKTTTVGEVRCGVDAGAIKRALEGQVKLLVPRGFSPQKFMQSLLAAYRVATQSGSVQAPIFDVYRYFVIQSQAQKFWRDAKSSLFTSVTLDQFRARLSRSLEGEGGRIANFQLRLFPPIDPKDALFLYQPSERRFGYVGRIEFVPVEAQRGLL